MNSNKSSILLLLAGLLAAYLIVKWTCQLIIDLLDYAFLILLIFGAVKYFSLPFEKRKAINQRVKSIIGF